MSSKTIARATAAFLTLSLLVTPLTAISQVVPPMPGTSPAPTQSPSGGPPALPPLIAPPRINTSRQPRAFRNPAALHLVPIDVRFLQTHPAMRTVLRKPLSQDRLVYIQQPPIAFKPLTLQDLPGRPQTANTLIRIPVPGGLFVTTSAGRSSILAHREDYRMVRAGTYLEAMNRIERAMNKAGYTLRAKPPAAKPMTIGGQAAYRVVVGRLIFNHALFDRQIRSLRALQHPLVATPRFRDLKADINLLEMVSHHQLAIAKLPQQIRGPILVHQVHYNPNLRPMNVPATASPAPYAARAGQTGYYGRTLVNPYAKINAPATASPAPYAARAGQARYGHAPVNVLANAAAASTPNPLANLPTYPGSFSWDYPINEGFGDPSTAQAYLDFDFTLDGDISKGADGEATAKAGITLFNNPFDIFTATAKFQGTDPSVTSADLTSKKSLDSASVTVTVIPGDTVYSKSASADWSDSWSKSETFVSITVPIPIMPGLDVAFTAAVAGTIGLAYNIGLHGIGVVATVTPSAGLTASFAVALSIDAVVASISAGVEGNLNLLTFSVDLIGAADIIGIQEGTPTMDDTASTPSYEDIYDVPTQLAFQYFYTINDNLTILSGKVDIFAQACLFWACAQYDVPLFSFPGTTLASGTLVNAPWTNVDIGGPFMQQVVRQHHVH